MNRSSKLTLKTRLFTTARNLHWLCVCLAIARPAWCDQWVFTLTPSHVQIENVNNSPLLYFNVAQSVINPASCGAVDGYAATDPVIVNQAYAAVLTAIATQQTISLYVSSSQCAVDGRPLVKIVQIP